ncbi:PucR family transcriptional regulator ligand-binding domain-containing protein (plasmid) [Cupriavidus sp. P-10]|uniref:PucR family transcriptional regulator n=1 Tax=Cupriavidus sp. P-10 TaxID=2027911 RepID=UPI001F1684A0|nr:PucR family transcriptional regulator [Cupriavidus sp. P-10]BDB28634.1 PucR family transcriptional regulator ligand-binding domain-containing protein [Cupriavidus sp. P-10]
MITVQELLDTDSLGLKGIAGLAGTHRLINWAHAVDLPDPWRWVSAGNLVMTTGTGIPRSPKEQVHWLELLAQTNCSALVVAPQAGAPKLSKQMLETAERLMFPVLGASFELEFVKLAHHVIESVLQAQRESLKASQRLFQTYAEAMRDHADFSGRLSVLAGNLGISLSIEDAASGVTLFASDSSPHRKPEQSATAESVAIGGRTRANLVIRRKKQKAPEDPVVVRSLVGLLAVELERLMIHRDDQREEGADLLRSLLKDDTDFAFVRPMLERRGLTGTLVCLAIQPAKAGPWSPAEIHQAPGLQNRTPLLFQDDVLLALSMDEQEALDAILRSLGDGTTIGISGPISVATGFRESVRQARLALVQAIERETTALRYGEAETGLIMAPKSLAEARALVGRYLGPLIEHDRVHETCLLTTLMRFLTNDGNWKATAFDLGIHRQTLVYRLKLVEQLTGLKPTSTDGTARFWIALTAGRNARLLPEQA